MAIKRTSHPVYDTTYQLVWCPKYRKDIFREERIRERCRQRQTAAHNALTIDGEDSSEVWGGFRVARRARVVDKKIITGEVRDVISASHDGFTRLNGVGLQHRTWDFSDRNLIISDRIDGSSVHRVQIFFHIHPGLRAEIEGKKCFVFDCRSNKVLTIELDEKLDIDLQDSTYHPEFGVSYPNQVLVCNARTTLPLDVLTRIILY